MGGLGVRALGRGGLEREPTSVDVEARHPPDPAHSFAAGLSVRRPGGRRRVMGRPASPASVLADALMAEQVPSVKRSSLSLYRVTLSL